jgi:riboflavin transporter FmnP
MMSDMIPFSLGTHIIASASTVVAVFAAKKVKEDKERV